ncbi:MAG TPA: response regulator transcription factor [Acidimicrobiia bacterium]
MVDPKVETGRTRRVVVVDDHELVRIGLRSLIDATSDLSVVGEAGTAAEGIDCVGNERPDVVTLDLRLPDFSGIEACRQIKDRYPDVSVLIVTSYADEAALIAAAAAGASGYVLKQLDSFGLVDAVRRVAGGGLAFGHDLDNQPQAESDPVLSRLAPQERAIAGYLADGLTNREIAERMSLAEKTVKNYVSHLLTKMNMSRRSHAAAYVARVEAQKRRWDSEGQDVRRHAANLVPIKHLS